MEKDKHNKLLLALLPLTTKGPIFNGPFVPIHVY